MTGAFYSILHRQQTHPHTINETSTVRRQGLLGALRLLRGEPRHLHFVLPQLCDVPMESVYCSHGATISATTLALPPLLDQRQVVGLPLCVDLNTKVTPATLAGCAWLCVLHLVQGLVR